MKLLKTNTIGIPEHKNNKETFSVIIDEIFNVCKHDKQNFNHEKLNLLDERLKESELKNEKQKSLFKDAVKIESDLNERMEETINYINRTRVKLLELLGSEL